MGKPRYCSKTKQKRKFRIDTHRQYGVPQPPYSFSLTDFERESSTRRFSQRQREIRWQKDSGRRILQSLTQLWTGKCSFGRRSLGESPMHPAALLGTLWLRRHLIRCFLA